MITGAIGNYYGTTVIAVSAMSLLAVASLTFSPMYIVLSWHAQVLSKAQMLKSKTTLPIVSE
jgi:hypothetical protein